MHRTTVYRLLKRVQREGESAFADGRHGHPVKLRGEVLTCLIEALPDRAQVFQVRGCNTPSLSASVLLPSVSQLNRVRAAWDSPVNQSREKKKPQAAFFA